MKLLIDAGNTRIKWAVINGMQWVAEGALHHSEAATLSDIARQHAVAPQVTAVNVAGAAIGDAIISALGPGRSIHWLASEAHACGVRNLYDNPAQLGADRWAALIGARAHHTGPCIVVSAGTATTIDLLASNGDFLGGMILPGEHLMRQALARDTAQLPLADGEPTPLPRNTANAIVAGCLHAQAGAIEHMFRRIADQTGALCLLAGGGAPRIQPLLDMPLQRIDNLVLRGLALVAEEKHR